METISKLKDLRITEARSLSRSATRIENGGIIIRGAEQLTWCLAAGLRPKHVFVSSPDALPDVLKKQCPAVYTVSPSILRRISDTRHIPEVVAVAFNKNIFRPGHFSIVLDHLRDAGNVGTIIRSAAAFGVRDFLTTDPALDLFLSRTIDASRGAVFRARCKRFASPKATAEYLTADGYQIIATSPRGSVLQSLLEIDERPVALIVGNEKNGADDALLDAAHAVVQIPMSAAMESLNAGVSAGISIHEIRFKETLLMLNRRIGDSLGRNLNVAAQLVRRIFEHEVEQVASLNGTQIIFLMVLRRERTMRAEHICRQFGVLPRHLQDFVRPLEEQGLVEQQSNEYGLGAAANELLAALWPINDRTESIALRGLTDEEKTTLNALLTRVIRNCSELEDTASNFHPGTNENR